MEDVIHCTYTGGTRVEIQKEGVKDMLHTTHDGSDAYVTPGDMLAGALGACTLTMMSVVTERAGYKLDGAKITLKPVFADNGSGLKEISLFITLPPDMPPELRKRCLAAVNACPVHRSLNPAIRFNVQLN